MTRAWQRYAEYAQTGEWHCHSSFTDGKNSVAEMCERAVVLGIPLIAFTEHVRAHLDYSFQDFLMHVRDAQDRHRDTLIVLSGCEIKILPGGELDCPAWIPDYVDHVVASVHGDLKPWAPSVMKALQDPRVCAWGHPTRHMPALRADEYDFLGRSLALACGVNSVAWERGTWLPMEWQCGYEGLGPGPRLRATDAHSVEELRAPKGD